MVCSHAVSVLPLQLHLVHTIIFIIVILSFHHSYSIYQLSTIITRPLSLKISLLLPVFHGRFGTFVIITASPFGCAGSSHFKDDIFKAVCS